MPRKRFLFSRSQWLVIGLIVLCLSGCVLLPCLQKVRDGEGWSRSQYSLKNIGGALRNYHETMGQLPPAVFYGKDGQPLYSWRVLLLPYIEENNLYLKFRLDEPWDSPHNKVFLEKMPRPYQPALGGNDPPGLTRYQVFTGTGTAFERAGLTWDDFPDGRSQTLLVVEAGEAVPWTKPVDLNYDPGKPLPPLGGAFGKPVHVLCYEITRRAGFNACFADGKARFILNDTDERAIRSVITRNGGEEVD